MSPLSEGSPIFHKAPQLILAKKGLAEAHIVKNLVRRRGFGQRGHDDVCFRQDPLIHCSMAEDDLSARILVQGFNFGFRASKQESESESTTVPKQAKKQKDSESKRRKQVYTPHLNLQTLSFPQP